MLAFSIIITFAFGKSIPTSIIVVDTKIWNFFFKKLSKIISLFSKSVLWADVFLVYQLARTGKIIRINEVLRSRRYFREDEREFDSWELKYKTLTERFRGPREIGDSKPSIYLYFPVWIIPLKF